MKKRSVHIDAREEPDSGSGDGPPSYRVDRVFAPAAPVSRARSSSPNLQAPPRKSTEAGLPNEEDARQLGELRTRLVEVQREFDETRTLWNAERAMLEEKARANHAAELANLRRDYETQIGELVSAHEAQLLDLRGAHEAELAAINEGFEAELGNKRALEVDALDAKTFRGERDRMATELADARAEAMREASERESIYQQEAELLVQHHEAELLRRDDELTAAKRALAEAMARTVTLEDELGAVRLQLDGVSTEHKRLELERLRLTAHLEEGLALLGVSRRSPTVDIEIKRGHDD